MVRVSGLKKEVLQFAYNPPVPKKNQEVLQFAYDPPVPNKNHEISWRFIPGVLTTAVEGTRLDIEMRALGQFCH